MPHYHSSKRSASPFPYADSSLYPGIVPANAVDIPIKAEASGLVPYSPTASNPIVLPGAAAESAASSAAGGFSLANIGGIVERLGGIDGIIATMGKVQKVMQTVQQFAPMAKMVAGLLPGGKGLKLQGGNGGNLDEYKPRRKSRGKKGSSRKRTSSGSKSRKKTGKRRR
ncbi:hypothetical protein D3C76_443030 [compost metagenome]